MNKNYLITTGGSGGHVIPAVILYEHLSRDAKVIITTDKRGLKYLNNENYQLRIIDTPRLNNIFLFPINFILVIILTIKSFSSIVISSKILKIKDLPGRTQSSFG